MTFYCLAGKQGLSFARPLSPTLVDPTQATRFPTQQDAQAALSAAREDALKKLRLQEAKRKATGVNTPHYLDATYQRWKRAIERLEATLSVEDPSLSNLPLSQWALVVEDGRWLHLRGGVVNLTPHPHEAAIFGSEQEAREIAKETHWTKSAAPFKASAAIVRLAVQFHSATPLTGTPKYPGTLNAFVQQWAAAHERSELEKDLSASAPEAACAPSTQPALSTDPNHSTPPSASLTGTPRKSRRRL